MAELNKILIIGRLTKDPELRYTQGGLPVCEFRIASNHTMRVKEEKREEVCYVDVTLFGRAGETAQKYLTKGREVLIDGRLQYNEWDGPDGQKRSKHRLVAERFQFLGSGGSRERVPEVAVETEEVSAVEESPPPPSSRHSPPADQAQDELPF